MNARLLHIKNKIAENTVDALLISSVPNIIYLTGYSGLSYFEREAFLLLTKNSQFILTDGRYSEAVKKRIKNFKLIETSSTYSFKNALRFLAEKLKIKKLGIEEKNITINESKILLSHYNDIYHYSNSLESFRAIKDRDEIKKIKKACKIGDEAFAYVLQKIKLGISEKELAFKIEIFIKSKGAEFSFPPIVAFGKNSSIPHHQTGNTRLSKNQIILLDFGVRIDNYCSDMTRTVFFGKADEKFKRIYQTVLGAQQKAVDFVVQVMQGVSLSRPTRSILVKRVDGVARDYITQQGFTTIPHSLGHGIGIEVHESPHLSPKSKDILREDMVFTIEPGIYLSSFGGVRIEDLVLLDKRGPILLTHSPKELIEI